MTSASPVDVHPHYLTRLSTVRDAYARAWWDIERAYLAHRLAGLRQSRTYPLLRAEAWDKVRASLAFHIAHQVAAGRTPDPAVVALFTRINARIVWLDTEPTER